jgi:hypothetical protein
LRGRLRGEQTPVCQTHNRRDEDYAARIKENRHPTGRI